MNITVIRVYKKLMPLKRPYAIARHSVETVEIVFLEIGLQNGLTGYGASCTDEEVVGESASQTLDNLQSDAFQFITGTHIRNFQAMIRKVREAFPAYPGTCAAADMALHDAFCKWLGISVVDFYGRAHERLLTSVTIGIKNVDDTIREAREYFSAGFRVLKIKTGLDAALDAERVIKIYECFGDHFLIRVDANTGYNLEQLRQFQHEIAAFPVELIEQPLPPANDNELLHLSIADRMMLAADESLKDAASALELAQSMQYGIFNIKLMKCGGIQAAFEIAHIAKPAGISLFWGCNDESIISISAALHAAYSVPHTRYIDLDGSFDLAEDAVQGSFILHDGYMYPGESPGLGVTANLINL